MKPAFLNVIAVFICVASGCSKQNEPIDVCTLNANIGTYHRKVVRVSAFLGTGPEQEALYDPNCQGGRWLVSIALNSNVIGPLEELRSIVTRKRHAYVTVEGKVYGPEPLEIDPNLPDWAKNRLKGSMKRYGHNDSFEMMLQVERVLEVKEMDDKTPPTLPDGR